MKRLRLSKLQAVTHLAAWLPLVALAVDFSAGNLTANPIQAAEQRTGTTALIFLILSLACTPLNSLLHLPALNRVRRPLGLYGYLYAALHLLIFFGLDYGFNLSQILRDVGEKRYILVGATAFILLSLLALTSFRSWMVRLGKRWKQLHRLVYLANLLVVLHFAWVVKGDFAQLQGDILRPLLAGLAVMLLLVLRIPAVKRRLSGRLRPGWPGRSTARAGEQGNSPQA